MTQTPQRAISFGPFVVDTPNACVLRDGAPVALTPKAFDVLHYLASRGGRLVTKEELLAAIWPDVVVSEASIKVCIREIRRALGDDAARPTIIQTIHRRGYRFIGGGTSADRASTSDPAAGDTSPSLDRPFVGRDAEIEWLKHAASTASGGERQVVFLAGDTGSGKTSIVEAFLSAVRAWQIGGNAEPALLVGHCFEQYGTSEPYLPLWEALTPLAHGDSPAAARIRDLLGRHVAAYTGDTAQPVGGLPRGMSERLRRDLVEALEELSRQLPLVVIVLEDLHWADYSTIDLISAFARRRGQARLMILGTYRPGDARTDGHPLAGVIATLLPARLAGELRVGYLDEAAVGRFLEVRFPGRREFPDALVRRLHVRTGGHPLFLANLVDDLLEKGLIRRTASGWAMGGDQSTSSLDGLPPELDQQVPRSVQAMVEGQLARLETDERQALEAAAIAGVEFSAASVAATLATARPPELASPSNAAFDAIVAAEDACESLAQRHRFLVPAGESEWPDGSIATRYRFTHELYHNVVYGLIPAARKARMHLTLGLRMEEIWRDRAGEVSAELAAHFERGRDWLRAVVHLRACADAAIKHYAHREAVTYLRRALAALDRLPPDQRSPHELPILMSLGVNLQVTRGFGSPKVQEIHARAYSLCRDAVAGGGSAADQNATFRVLWGIWVFHKVRSDLAKAAEMAGQLMTLARQSGDSVQLLQAHQAMCVTNLCLGDFTTAVGHTEEGLAIYRDGDHAANTRLFGQDPGVAVAAFGSAAYALLGRLEDSHRVSEHSLKLAARLGQPSTLAVAYHFAAMHRQIVGDIAGAEHFAREGLALAFEERFSFWHAGARVLIGWSLARQGRVEGIDDIRKGIASWLATGSRTYHSYFLGLLSDALSATGQAAAARATAAEGLTVADELSEGIYREQLRKMLA